MPEHTEETLPEHLISKSAPDTSDRPDTAVLIETCLQNAEAAGQELACSYSVGSV